MPLGPNLGSYFRLTRPGSYLNEWAESQNCTFTGHRDIKTACVETAVKYEIKSLKSLMTLSQNKVQNALFPTGYTLHAQLSPLSLTSTLRMRQWNQTIGLHVSQHDC